MKQYMDAARLCALKERFPAVEYDAEAERQPGYLHAMHV